MIKGHTKIELTDARTGEKSIVEHDNMITNAIEKEVLKTYGLISGPSICAAYKSNNVNTSNSIAVQLFGGLYLWENELTSDADDYFLPTNNNLTGYSWAGAENSTNNHKLGSYSASQSGLQPDGSYKHVWQFSTEQGNGQISSISLCPNVAGVISAGIEKTELNSTKYLTSSVQTTSTSYTFQTFTFSNNTSCIVDIDDNYIYTIRRDSFTTYYESTENFLKTNGKKLKVYRYQWSNKLIGLNQGVFVCGEEYDSFEIQLPNEFDVSALSNGLAISGIFVQRKGLLYISFTDGHVNNNSISVAKIDIQNRTAYNYNITIPATRVDISTKNLASFSGFLYAHESYTIDDDILYIVDSTDNAKLYYCDLNGIDNGTIINAANFLHLYTITIPTNNILFRTNDNIGECGIIKKDKTIRYLCIQTLSNLVPEYMRDFTAGYFHIYSNSIYSATMPLFLTTKNNLESSVIKTSSQSMTITYTLTPA